MKSWYQSKTLWFNAIAAALVALEAGTGFLKPLLGENTYALFAVALPVVNSILRVVTKTGIGSQNA